MLAWLAHLYTASGAVFAFLAARAVIDFDYRAAFFWLGVQVIVDATDGALARALRVSERLPWFNGAKLDDIIDYLMYVFVPALVVWQADMVPAAFPICAAMVLSSAYGFSQADAKVASTDHFFTGFPSYWNIVVGYLYVLQLSQRTNAIILVTLAVLVFVPIRYIYPSRTKTLKWPTLVLGSLWALLFTWVIWRLPAVDGPWAMISLIFPAYYFALSLWLQFRR